MLFEVKIMTYTGIGERKTNGPTLDQPRLGQYPRNVRILCVHIPTNIQHLLLFTLYYCFFHFS